MILLASFSPLSPLPSENVIIHSYTIIYTHSKIFKSVYYGRKKEKNVKRNKHEDPVVVRSDRPSSYLQRSQSEEIQSMYTSVIKTTKSVKIKHGIWL